MDLKWHTHTTQMYTYIYILSHSHTISRDFFLVYFRRIILFLLPVILTLLGANICCIWSHCMCVCRISVYDFFSVQSHTFSLILVCFRYYWSGKQQKCYSILINIFDLRWDVFFYFRNEIISVFLVIFFPRRFSFLAFELVGVRFVTKDQEKKTQQNGVIENNGLKNKISLKSLYVWNQVKKLKKR